MRCYYEVLNVPRDADESEIKVAYKRLALKWHPDKNLDNADEAKETFQLVQQAYEVLIDRQERAWYDNHREQILRGSDKEYEDNSLDVFKYFTSSCFAGYGDDEHGFYKVYARVFEEIAKEDMEYMDSKEEFCDVPMFGMSTSDYESVVGPFYDHWMSYSTRKSYVWLDPYDVRETRDRKVLKLIEKENKKVRSKARKERNDEVRELVAFVRKRDRRVQAYNKLREEKALQNKLRSAEISRQRRMERRREIDESSEQAEWTKFDNVQSELEDIERSLAEEFGADEDVSDDDDENLYCIACNKLFKTPKAYQNHESSKRHRENVDRLREDLLQDESENSDEEPERIEEEPEAVVDEPEEKSRKKSKKKKRAALAVPKSDDEVEEVDPPIVVDEVDELDPQVPVEVDDEPKKKGKKKKRAPIEEEARTKRRGKERTTTVPPNEVDNCCRTCAGKFESKNKLFTHLKSTGHGVYTAKSVKAGGK